MANIRIRLKRSLIGTTKKQRETARCLGLKKTNQQIVVPDHPATRGQILAIQHLLDVKMEK